MAWVIITRDTDGKELDKQTCDVIPPLGAKLFVKEQMYCVVAAEYHWDSGFLGTAWTVKLLVTPWR